MAEFSDVMHYWKRMCMANGDKCEDCPIGNERICVTEIADVDDDEFKRVEVAVSEWAAEHPEPVYPTWGEWFVACGYLPGGYFYRENPEWLLEKLDGALKEKIPADIAEKLGIEPKEG